MRPSLLLFPILILSLATCGQDELACTLENHCVLNDNDEATCESGFRWVDSTSADNFRCEEIPHIDVPVLGNGVHTVSAVTVTTLATVADGLNTPRDLEFHPTTAGQLWIVNRQDSSVVILNNAGSTAQTSQKIEALSNGFDTSGLHFLAAPAALAFADDGNFATIHETDKETQGPVSAGGTPWDFMGPTLWTSNLGVFNGGHSGHLDMMHNSPLGMGIAWEKDNVYWIFDGQHSSITRYDFGPDHGAGGTWHDDGVVSRYVPGQVKRTADVVSHMVLDPSSNLLYIADTGNGRIATLDITSGTRGRDMPYNEIYDCYQHPGSSVTCSDYHMMDGASLQTFVTGATHGLSQPSGLALHQGVLYVSDYTTGTIFAFNGEGMLMDWLDLGRPQSLGGLELDSAGNLYVVDTKTNEVLQISPL